LNKTGIYKIQIQSGKYISKQLIEKRGEFNFKKPPDCYRFLEAFDKFRGTL
jgi:hypothetical protein